MCLALPAQITRLLDQERAIINLGGIKREISLALVQDVNEGDYVIVHVGYALTRLDRSEAEKTLQLLAEFNQRAVENPT